MMNRIDHHALLIGIDCYMPNRLPSGASYHRLAGCVRDVDLMEGMLRTLLAIPDEHIVKLSASGRGDRPTEPPSLWPTRKNIIEAFGRVTEAAHPGDHVYIHYSGHGGRAHTLYEAAKGPHGIDETLVPTDIGHDDGGHIRDLELAKLIGAMVDKGLLVAMTLDCCHSGGMTRNATSGATRRGIADIDVRRSDRGTSFVAPDEAVTMLAGRATRGVERITGLLPEPVGYTVLAACLKTEFAHELAFDGQPQGALTHWLLRLLPQLGPHATYKSLCDRLVAQVHTQLPAQTPVVMGEVDRVILGADRRPVRYTTRILSESPERGACLDVGRAHGVTRGAHFVALADGTTSLDDRARLADLIVREVGDVRSWADVTTRASSDLLDAGTPAVLVGPSSATLVQKVLLRDGARSGLQAALAVAGWVELVGEDDSPDLQVALDDGCYQILDAVGEPLPWLRPAIAAGQPDAAARVVARLEHISRFRAILQLANHDSGSRLAHGLVLELRGWSPACVLGEPFEPSAAFEGPAALEVGQWTALRIRNAAEVPLNVCLLDLQPGWSVTQVWPTDGAGFRTLDPGEHEDVVMQAGLPPDLDHGVDVLKVFATVGTTDFRWLELPSLDEPPRPRRGAPQGPLEQLLVALGKARPAMRHVVLPVTRSSGWTTAQVELTVRRGAARPRACAGAGAHSAATIASASPGWTRAR